jgi:hypothetical protein
MSIASIQGQSIRYDATHNVHMQVLLHKKRYLAGICPQSGGRPERGAIRADHGAGERTRGGSGIQRHAGITVARGCVAEESPQQPQRRVRRGGRTDGRAGGDPGLLVPGRPGPDFHANGVDGIPPRGPGRALRLSAPRGRLICLRVKGEIAEKILVCPVCGATPAPCATLPWSGTGRKHDQSSPE